MDFTSRMVELLSAVRRERNGAVADAMRCYGRRCGLNYGVSLPTVRALARACARDAGFARYLFRQDVRELRLAALHLADPAGLTLAEAEEWGSGIDNSEIAEEAAFALFSRAAVFAELFPRWVSSENPLLVHTALMAAVRRHDAPVDWTVAAMEALRRHAADAPLSDPKVRLLAGGAAALLASVGSRNEENRQAVLRIAGSRGEFPAADFIHEELAWRLDVQPSGSTVA